MKIVRTYLDGDLEVKDADETGSTNAEQEEAGSMIQAVPLTLPYPKPQPKPCSPLSISPTVTDATDVTGSSGSCGKRSPSTRGSNT